MTAAINCYFIRILKLQKGPVFVNNGFEANWSSRAKDIYKDNVTYHSPYASESLVGFLLW